MSQSETASKPRVIRDKAFAKRLETAVQNHPGAPDGHGRQKWLRERIEARFGVKVSPEATRKWFAGEARPRPQLMSQIAQVCEVDEAWLALAITPQMSEQEKRHHNANAKGAVNLVAGMIQLAGGSIAFPTQGETIDLYAIIGGQQHSIIVRSGRHIELSLHAFNVPINHSSSVVLFVSQHTETSYSIYRVPTELIAGGDK